MLVNLNLSDVRHFLLSGIEPTKIILYAEGLRAHHMLNDLEQIESEKRVFASIIVLGIAFLTLADMIFDKSDGVGWSHLVIEMFVIVGCLSVLLCLWWHTLVLSANQRVRLQNNIVTTRADLEQWKAKTETLLAGLGNAIQQQFSAWKLTEAEQDVALLLLKGLSIKEIACIRKTAEKTVRHQAAAIYSKGNIEGRSDLSAFFLEDLLLPQGASGQAAREKV